MSYSLMCEAGLLPGPDYWTCRWGWYRGKASQSELGRKLGMKIYTPPWQAQHVVMCGNLKRFLCTKLKYRLDFPNLQIRNPNLFFFF